MNKNIKKTLYVLLILWSVQNKHHHQTLAQEGGEESKELELQYHNQKLIVFHMWCMSPIQLKRI